MDKKEKRVEARAWKKPEVVDVDASPSDVKSAVGPSADFTGGTTS
ncbi:hypothetical protein [Sphingorhabdus sp. Alg239-R122]|nr:hypothetical protein [Sphingorhabdus sp. Alg239-R122]